MKKNITNCIITIIFFAFLCFFVTDCVSYAFDEYSKEEYNSVLSEYNTDFTDALDKESQDVLDSLGLLDFDYEKIINFSAADFINAMFDDFKANIKAPLKTVSVIFIIICLSSLFQSFKDATEGSEIASLYSTVSALVIALLLLSEIKETISLSVGAISVCADFIYAFIPAFCVIVAASGNTVTAFSANTVLIFLGQAVNFVAENVFLPLSNCFLALGICAGIRSELNLEVLISTMKKYVTGAISLCATAFISVLSIRTAVSARADALGLRSVRFAINSVVPVIGGAISEGLLSIQAYSSLIKSSVGIVGIISISLVFLPSIISVAAWRILLSLCVVISDIFRDNSVACVIKAFLDGLLIINVILILTMVTTIISIGILIAARGSSA